MGTGTDSAEAVGRRRSDLPVVFLSSALVLFAIAIAWLASDLKKDGVPVEQWRRHVRPALLVVPIAIAALTTVGVRLADAKLARISSRRPGTHDAAQIPRLAQAALLAFLGGLFSWTAYVAAMFVPTDDRWLLHVIAGGPQLVVMYYFAHRFIDIDMILPDVRPWFLSTMIALGFAGMATAKFFSSRPSRTWRGYTSADVTVPLLILAVFASIGMSVKRNDEPTL